MKDAVTPNDLRQVLRYDPSTGDLFWRVRADMSPMWNGRYANKPAFTATNGNGYRCGRAFRTNFLAHRVIWAILTGSWPEEQIDHINGCRSDNRAINLRAVSGAENMKNRRLLKRSSTGRVGVCRDRKEGEYRAYISVGGGKPKTLITGVSFEVACLVRARHEKLIGYHQNHGLPVSDAKHA